MSDLRRFQPGERVVIREVLNEKVWTSRPVTILEDSDAHVVSWLAPGTLIDYPVGVQHGATCFSMWRSGVWDLYAKEFNAPGHLRIAPRGAPFEVFAPWTSSGGVASWYVNFQRPLERTAWGFDTMDEILDLVVSPDARHWLRKDEDELALAVEMGVVDPRDAQRLIASCADLEESLERGVVPWRRDLATWSALIDTITLR